MSLTSTPVNLDGWNFSCGLESTQLCPTQPGLTLLCLNTVRVNSVDCQLATNVFNFNTCQPWWMKFFMGTRVNSVVPQHRQGLHKNKTKYLKIQMCRLCIMLMLVYLWFGTVEFRQNVQVKPFLPWSLFILIFEFYKSFGLFQVLTIKPKYLYPKNYRNKSNLFSKYPPPSPPLPPYTAYLLPKHQTVVIVAVPSFFISLFN